MTVFLSRCFDQHTELTCTCMCTCVSVRQASFINFSSCLKVVCAGLDVPYSWKFSPISPPGVVGENFVLQILSFDNYYIEHTVTLLYWQNFIPGHGEILSSENFWLCGISTTSCHSFIHFCYCSVAPMCAYMHTCVPYSAFRLSICIYCLAQGNLSV